jgi:dihydrofolate reductase
VRPGFPGFDKEGAYAGTWHGPSFVLTHHVDQPPAEDVTFVGDLDTAVTAARAAAGDGYVSILGADVARQCLEACQLDEILVMVLPVLLGDGTRLFDVTGGRNVPLEQISLTPLPTGFNVWLRVAAGA